MTKYGERKKERRDYYNHRLHHPSDSNMEPPTLLL
jgi:hypothetical protein